ncbi:hypothetical protein AB0J52_24265 [Spirillospora sp. NPDC049652]
MRNWAKHVSRAALVAGGLTAMGMGPSCGSALAGTVPAAPHRVCGHTDCHGPVPVPHMPGRPADHAGHAGHEGQADYAYADHLGRPHSEFPRPYHPMPFHPRPYYSHSYHPSHAYPRPFHSRPHFPRTEHARPGVEALPSTLRLAAARADAPTDIRPGGQVNAEQMSPMAKSLRKLIRSAGIPVPGPDSGPNDPQVPPRLPIEGLPLSVAGKKIPFLGD